MKLPSTIAKEVIAAAGKAIAAEMRDEVAGSQLLTLQEAADLLRVSKPTVRSLLGGYVDLGASSPRVRLVDVQKLIDSRRVPA